MKFRHTGFGLALLALGTAGAFAQKSLVPYPKLYVCNNEGTDFMVVDMETHEVVKTVDVGGQPHGIAVPAKGDRAYISCSGPNDVVAIDTETDRILWRADCGPNPHSIAVTPDGRYAYVGIFGAAGERAETEVFDTRLGKRIKTIQTGRGPHVLYALNNQHVYVTAWLDHHVSVIDVASQSVVRTIPVPGIPRPIAVDPSEERLYVALSGFHGFVVADIAKGRVDNLIELPPFPPGAPVPEHNTPVHGLDFRPGGKELYVTSVIDDKIYIYDMPGLGLAGRIEVGDGPNWIAFTPEGDRAYVTNALENTVSVIDTNRRKVIATIRAGAAPKRLAVIADRTGN